MQAGSSAEQCCPHFKQKLDLTEKSWDGNTAVQENNKSSRHKFFFSFKYFFMYIYFFFGFSFLIFIYNIVVTPRLTTAFSFTVAHFFRKYVYIHKYIAYIWYVYVYMCICVCICMLRCVSFRFSINLMLDFIELSF